MNVVVGDALALPLADGSVDAIATDPPYSLEFMGDAWIEWSPSSPRFRSGWDRTAASHDVHGLGNPNSPVTYASRRRTWECECGRRDGFRDANDHGCRPAVWSRVWTDPEPLESQALANWHRAWLAEALRVVKPGGYAAIFTAGRFLGPLLWAAEHAGWDVLDVGAWLYSGQSPGYSPLRGMWTPWVLAQRLGPGPKRLRERYDDGSGGWAPNAVSTAPNIAVVPRLSTHSTERVAGPNGRHPTQKPLELMRYVVSVVSEPGDLVLDPFAGSGTTLVAATVEGRRAVGVEVNEDYAAIARRRTSEGRAEPSAAIPQGRLL